MSLLDQAFKEMFTEKRSSASAGKSVMSDFFGLFSIAEKGAGVNYKRALKLSAVFNAVDQISSSVAIIPFGVYKKTKDGRERLVDHPVDTLLSSEPDGSDGYLTSFIFKKILETSVLLRGNALFEIVSNNAGVSVLRYIAWDDVKDIVMVENALVYVIKGGKNLLANEVLHFKGFTHDGIVGVSAITYGAMQMGMALEVQSFSATSIGNKGVRTGVIETEKTVTGGKTKIIEAWKTAMQTSGPDRVVVLDEGLKFKPITITPQEAQIIEMNRFTIEDIARWFNIAPHKIKSLQQSTNNNIEQQSLDYSSDTLQPHVTNIEQEFSKKLFTVSEKRQQIYVSGNMSVLLRSDIKSRGEYYSKMVQIGVYTRNEVRAKEELNYLPGLDEPLTPVNTQTQSQIDANTKENE